MDDIVPELLKKIRDDFDNRYKSNDSVKRIIEKITSGEASYEDAYEYAYEVGEMLSKSFLNNLSSDVLPDGKMYYNIAQRILDPTMKQDYMLITDVTSKIQTFLNKKSNIGIKAIIPELNQDRIDGIVNRISSEDNFSNVSWILKDPIKNFSINIVDDSIKENVEFHAKSGMKPKIVRKLSGNCCDWCRSLAGTYVYPNVPDDVYRRHNNCRCTVDYYPGDGKVQNVHSKAWQTEKERDKIEIRKTIGISKQKDETRLEKAKRNQNEKGLEFILKIVNHPKLLQSYGYKINFGGDGLFQFHPEKGSHHKGPYYKISTGKGGTKRYELDGNEKKD